MAEHVALVVNGTRREVDVEPRRLLVQLLREDLDLTGTHVGCDTSQCGCCTVLVNGKAVSGCLYLAAFVDGAEVVTIEHDAGGGLDAVQQAFIECGAFQCGFCTPVMLIMARDIVERLGDVDEDRIRIELSGNLCRCTGYVGIVKAIRSVIRSHSSL